MECARQEELGTDRLWLEFSHWRAKIVIVEVGVWDLGLHYNIYIIFLLYNNFRNILVYRDI